MFQIFFCNRPTLWFGDQDTVQDYAESVMTEIINDAWDSSFNKDSDWTGAYWDAEVQEWFALPSGQYQTNTRYGIRDVTFEIRQVESVNVS
jgi:hypothetical protein